MKAILTVLVDVLCRYLRNDRPSTKLPNSWWRSETKRLYFGHAVIFASRSSTWFQRWPVKRWKLSENKRPFPPNDVIPWKDVISRCVYVWRMILVRCCPEFKRSEFSYVELTLLPFLIRRLIYSAIYRMLTFDCVVVYRESVTLPVAWTSIWYYILSVVAVAIVLCF